MAVNQTVVKAMLATYTRASLEAARATALADILAGVQITQVTFEGGGASGRQVSADPNYLVEHIQAALDQLDDADLAARPSSAYIDLSKRIFGT
jgi:hypothetical protein